MKLTLIKPNIGRREHSLYVDEARMEPLPLGVLASLTPEDVEVVMYDDRMEVIPFDESTDLVAITVETYTARRAYEISEEFKSRGVKVLMGGMHAKLIPEEVSQHCDSIMIGDAEDKWEEMIHDFEAGKLKKVYNCRQLGIPQQHRLVRRDIYKGKKYLPISLLQFSRGCRYSCNYCASSVYFEHQHYCREVAEVIREIENQNRKFLFFVDDNIISNREKAKELFRALIPMKVKWVSQASIDMLEDSELMELMMKSGCLGHVIGFESIKPESLNDMNKYVNRRFVSNRYEKAIAELRNYGLQTWAAFTVGHDSDTYESIKETYRFALENKFTFAAYNILMPYPNTQLYRKLEAEDRLLYGGKWWLHPEYRFNYAAFKPKNMTADELTEVSFYCRKKYNSASSIIYRAFEPKTNMRNLYRFATYCIYNPVFKKEVFKKQGMRFGLKNNTISEINNDLQGRKP